MQQKRCYRRYQFASHYVEIKLEKYQVKYPDIEDLLEKQENGN